jgi:hypothetical protein
VSNDKPTHGGLSVKTLLIAAAASAAAAIVIPLLWRPGTVFAAAMTPVVVALVTEMLRRPVDTVGSVRSRRPARGAEALDQPFDEPFDPLAPPSAEELDELPRTREAPRAVHRRRPLTARQWKLALATGLAAFAIVAALFTASELLAGDAVSGGSRTTFFGGGGSSSKSGGDGDGDRRERQRERDDAEPTATATPEPEATATPTPTPTPEATATPTPTVAPPVPADPAPTP